MTSTPWHFWPIVTVAFVWHLFGAFDYTATLYEFEPWMQMLNQRQLIFVETMPAWAIGAWAVAVWGGLLGALLLAARARFAPFVLAVSAIGLIVVAIWANVMSTPEVDDVASPAAAWILIGSAVLGVLLWLYARTQHRRGVV